MYIHFNTSASQTFTLDCLVYFWKACFVEASFTYHYKFWINEFWQIYSDMLISPLSKYRTFPSLQNLLWGPLLSTNCPHFEPMQLMTCLQINKIKLYVVFASYSLTYDFCIDSILLLNESGVHLLLQLFIHCTDILAICLSIHQGDGLWGVSWFWLLWWRLL